MDSLNWKKFSLAAFMIAIGSTALIQEVDRYGPTATIQNNDANGDSNYGSDDANNVADYSNQQDESWSQSQGS